MNYIEVTDLSFQYDTTPVLDRVSFTVEAGEFVILTGENGTAKSTLLKNILGFLTPKSGKVIVSETNVNGQKLQIGYVPQEIASFNVGFPSTVYEFVASGRYQQGKWFKKLDATDHDHIKRALKSVGMEALADRKIGELSGGQKQRICLARVFATDPDIFIMDEPTSSMDKESRTDFYRLLRHNTQKHGKAILMVTHEDELVKDFVDKQIHLVREEGAPWKCFSMTSCKEPSKPVS